MLRVFVVSRQLKPTAVPDLVRSDMPASVAYAMDELDLTTWVNPSARRHERQRPPPVQRSDLAESVCDALLSISSIYLISSLSLSLSLSLSFFLFLLSVLFSLFLSVYLSVVQFSRFFLSHTNAQSRTILSSFSRFKVRQRRRKQRPAVVPDSADAAFSGPLSASPSVPMSRSFDASQPFSQNSAMLSLGEFAGSGSVGKMPADDSYGNVTSGDGGDSNGSDGGVGGDSGGDDVLGGDGRGKGGGGGSVRSGGGRGSGGGAGRRRGDGGSGSGGRGGRHYGDRVGGGGGGDAVGSLGQGSLGVFFSSYDPGRRGNGGATSTRAQANGAGGGMSYDEKDVYHRHRAGIALSRVSTLSMSFDPVGMDPASLPATTPNLSMSPTTTATTTTTTTAKPGAKANRAAGTKTLHQTLHQTLYSTHLLSLVLLVCLSFLSFDATPLLTLVCLFYFVFRLCTSSLTCLSILFVFRRCTSSHSCMSFLFCLSGVVGRRVDCSLVLCVLISVSFIVAQVRCLMGMMACVADVAAAAARRQKMFRPLIKGGTSGGSGAPTAMGALSR